MAVCAIKSGQFVVLVDLDPQHSSLDWFEMRGCSNELVTVQSRPEDLAVLMEKAEKNGADLIIIDTPPHTEKACLLAAEQADLVLVPCRPATFDFKVLPATFSLLEHTKKPAEVLINAAPPVGKLAEETATHLKNAGYPVFPAIISQRVAFTHAVSDGGGVHEYENEGKAAAEINALWGCIKERLINDNNK